MVKEIFIISISKVFLLETIEVYKHRVNIYLGNKVKDKRIIKKWKGKSNIVI